MSFCTVRLQITSNRCTRLACSAFMSYCCLNLLPYCEWFLLSLAFTVWHFNLLGMHIMIIKCKLLLSMDDAKNFGTKLKLNIKAVQKSCAILREGALSSSHPAWRYRVFISFLYLHCLFALELVFAFKLSKIWRLWPFCRKKNMHDLSRKKNCRSTITQTETLTPHKSYKTFNK